jgi:hypothetical protein
LPPELAVTPYHWEPRAFVTLNVDGEILDFCQSYTERVPVLEFAMQLNEIIQDLKVGEERELFILLSGLRRYFRRVDEDTVEISAYFDAADHKYLGSLSEFKESCERFCMKLYSEILLHFPEYFDYIDRQYPSTPEQPKVSSRDYIRELLAPKAKSN